MSTGPAEDTRHHASPALQAGYVMSLAAISGSDMSYVGAKAANLGELASATPEQVRCLPAMGRIRCVRPD